MLEIDGKQVLLPDQEAFSDPQTYAQTKLDLDDFGGEFSGGSPAE